MFTTVYNQSGCKNFEKPLGDNRNSGYTLKGRKQFFAYVEKAALFFEIHLHKCKICDIISSIITTEGHYAADI